MENGKTYGDNDMSEDKKSFTELNQDICNTGVKFDHVYRHWKGTLYRVVNIVIDCNTNEPIIVYNDISQYAIGQAAPLFARKVSEWNEVIDDNGTRRFEAVRAVSLMLTEKELQTLKEKVVDDGLDRMSSLLGGI